MRRRRRRWRASTAAVLGIAFTEGWRVGDRRAGDRAPRRRGGAGRGARRRARDGAARRRCGSGCAGGAPRRPRADRRRPRNRTLRDARRPRHHAPGHDAAGAACTAFLARPTATRTQPRPAVIVIHEIMGLNDDIRRIATVFAVEGYVDARAGPRWGRGSSRCASPASSRASARSGTGRPYREMAAFQDWLAKQPYVDADRIGMAGFCAGRRLHDAVRGRGGRRLRAIAPFYGALPADESLHPGPLPDRRLVRRPRPVLRRARPEARGRPRGRGHPQRREDLPGRRALVHEPARGAHGRGRPAPADARRLRRGRLDGRVGPGARLLRRAPRGRGRCGRADAGGADAGADGGPTAPSA